MILKAYPYRLLIFFKKKGLNINNLKLFTTFALGEKNGFHIITGIVAL
jgi:hypothetical protein